LIHWNIGEAEQRAETLRRAGHEVLAGPFESGGFASLRDDPPDAVVIDLTRLPAQGRDVALVLRTTKATRRVPLVFVAGDPQKVARIVELLPDAVYTTWRGIGGAIRRAIARPPVDPVVPQSNFAGYSATPLPKKLGIKSGATVILVAAPDDFQRTLGKLPAGVTLRRRAAGRNELVIWFVRSRRDLQQRIARLVAEKELGRKIRPDATGRARGRSGLGSGRLQDLRRRRDLVGTTVYAAQAALACSRERQHRRSLRTGGVA